MTPPSMIKLLRMGCEIQFPRGERISGKTEDQLIELKYYETPIYFTLDRDGLMDALLEVDVYEKTGTVRLSQKRLIERI